MGNVTLPTPVLVVGGVGCLLAGALVGAVFSPGHDRSVATVASFDAHTSRLCLKGDGVDGQKGVDSNGELCGVWRRSGVVTRPATGDRFRYVTVRTPTTASGRSRRTVIYGVVVK